MQPVKLIGHAASTAARGDRATDAEIDAWIDEAMARGDAVDVEMPEGTEPLLDPATAKAVRSNAQMMQKASDPDKD